MNAFFSTVVTLLFLGCLNQVSGQGCMSIDPFIATTFDAVDFKFYKGYHDLTNFRSLFVEENGNWKLYDFINGRITFQENGVCTYYTNANLVLDMSRMVTNFIDPDFNGVIGQGYTLQQGNTLIRGVLDTQACVEIFTYIGVDNKPYTILMRDNVQTANVDAEIRSNVDPVISYIQTANCMPVGLPY